MAHSSLQIDDTFSLPASAMARVIQRVEYMGDWSASYSYAQERAGDLLRESASTLMRISARVEHENQVIFTPTQLAKALRISGATMHAHLAKLREAGVLIPDPKEPEDARSYRVWRVCPFLAWRGSGKKMVEYVKGLPSDHPFLAYIDPKALKKALTQIEECEPEEN